MNVKCFFETLAEVYAKQTNVKVARVKIIEKQSPATKNDCVKAKCKSA